MGKFRERTFTGCWKCRSRKVKCDETRPSCLKCQRIGAACTGYDVRFSWAHGDEDQQMRPAGRRPLSRKSTWKGLEVLSSDLVDLLILRCDELANNEGASTGGCSVVPSSLLRIPHNPFSVFPTAPRDQPATDDDSQQYAAPKPSLPNHEEGLAQGALEMALWASPDLFPGRSERERYLFHHYITWVAAIMMPYAHPKNPWAIYYPAAALQLREETHDALYNAILAQAAFNLVYLGRGWDNRHKSGMAETGTKHYGDAMRRLRPAIGWSDLNFPQAVATAITLMMTELYSGRPRHWRHHLRGAWNLYLNYGASGSRMSSVLARVSVQSLKIMKIIADTSACGADIANDIDEVGSTTGAAAQDPGACGGIQPFHSPTTTRPMTEFFFTVGAPSDVMNCISRITAFRNKPPSLRRPCDTDDLVESVLACLRRYRPHRSTMGDRGSTCFTALETGEELLLLEDTPKDDAEGSRNTTDGKSAEAAANAMAAPAYLQMQAFIRAAHIYLYRTVLNAPPRAVQQNVAETFASVSAFIDSSGDGAGLAGNFSLWPAFIAAVEATRDEDIAAAKNWIDWALSFGIGIRRSVRTVVEEVWRRRDTMAAASGMERGLIAVDWLQVILELDCDLLLI